MKYLSIDIEATGLREKDFIIEFAAIAFDTNDGKIYDHLSYHTLVQCPSYQVIEPQLDDWVKKHNKVLIDDAHNKGKSLIDWKNSFEAFLKREDVKQFLVMKKLFYLENR